MSDLISREEVIKVYGDIHPLDYNAIAYKSKIESIPSADIMECARAIKEYCKERMKKPLWCNDCPLYEMFCKNSQPPNMWDLPEGEKE